MINKLILSAALAVSCFASAQQISNLSAMGVKSNDDLLYVIDVSESGATRSKNISLADLGEHYGVAPRNTIVVDSAGGRSSYLASDVDGVDDYQPLSDALDFAIANMPAIVRIGAGNYELHQTNSGLIKTVPDGASGLHIIGAGSGQTIFNITDDGCVPANCKEWSNRMVALRLQNTSQAATESQYMIDISVTGITFYDDDPAEHTQTQSGTEQTHGLGIQYAKRVRVHDVTAIDIGDEGIEFDYVVGGSMLDVFAQGTPAQEQGGGGAFSIKNGCRGVVLDGFHVDGNGASSNLTWGVAVKGSSATPIEDIIITNGFIFNAKTAGISLAMTEGELTGLLISNVTIDTVQDASGNGIERISTQLIKNVVIDNVTIKNITGNGIDMLSNFNTDWTMNNVTLDNIDGVGLKLHGSRVEVNNLHANDVEGTVIYMREGSDVLVQGGFIEESAINADTIIWRDTGFGAVRMTVKHTQIVNTTNGAALYITRSVEHIDGITVTGAPTRAGAQFPYVHAFTTLKNSVLNNTGAFTNTDKPQVLNNYFNSDGALGSSYSPIEIGTLGDSCIVMGNFVQAVNNAAVAHAIDVGGTECVVSSNNTIESTPSLIDAATSNTVKIGNVE